jgi:hypothetical protein
VSARRGSTNTFTQTPARLLARPSTVCGPNAVAFACSDTTGGLRPPALVLRCERLLAKNDFFRCTHAHPTKSGGRQPAVGSIAPRGQCTASNVRRVTTVQPGAAGVSPPWISNSGGIVNVYHGGLTPTAPGCATCVRRAKAPFAMHKRTFSRAANVSPPWISNSGGIVNVYHGGLTPTAPGCATCVRRAKAPFAMHKRTSDQERRASVHRAQCCER